MLQQLKPHMVSQTMMARCAVLGAMLSLGAAQTIDPALQLAYDCAFDFDRSGRVGTSDLLHLLALFGRPVDDDHQADFDNDNVIGTSDLLSLLAAYGSTTTGCPAAAVTASTGCPCISYPWAGSAAFENAAGSLDVDLGADGVFAYPTTYGMDYCYTHDVNMDPYCADASGVPLAGAPGWCASPWCFIDVNNCNVANDPSSYFHGSNPALTYSYETCSATNSFIDTSHDPAACDGTHSAVVAAHCFVNGHPIADGRCPCIDTWSRADANGAWPGDGATTLTVTLEGADYAYPWGYGMGNCAPHDYDMAPYCADAQGIVLANAPSWCQSNWCFVDAANCNLDAEVLEHCTDATATLTPAAAAVVAVAEDATATPPITAVVAVAAVAGSCCIGEVVAVTAVAADATATPPIVAVAAVAAVAGSCSTDTYVPYSAAVSPASSSYFHGSVPALMYSYETCQHSNTFQDTLADPQACNDQHSAVIADHCLTAGHQAAHADCPCLTWPWAAAGQFITPAGSAADAAGISLTVDLGADGIFQYPIGYGMSACAPHDSLLPPYCADGTGAVLPGAPGWCTSNWCFVDVNNCVGMTNTDGSAAAPDPSSYFAGSTPTLVYSYQTCAADNTFIGTVHDNTATQLTAQITYAIDIATIASGTAARATFETEFVAAIVAAMSVDAADVVINSIQAAQTIGGRRALQTASTTAAVVVDFTVWASATDAGAATVAFVALTPADLTIASGGVAPTVASTTVAMAAFAVDCAGSWSACTTACEAAAARTWTETTAQAGSGAFCVAATNCGLGDGACMHAPADACADPACTDDDATAGQLLGDAALTCGDAAAGGVCQTLADVGYVGTCCSACNACGGGGGAPTLIEIELMCPTEYLACQADATGVCPGELSAALLASNAPPMTGSPEYEATMTCVMAQMMAGEVCGAEVQACFSSPSCSAILNANVTVPDMSACQADVDCDALMMCEFSNQFGACLDPAAGPICTMADIGTMMSIDPNTMDDAAILAAMASMTARCPDCIAGLSGDQCSDDPTFVDGAGQACTVHAGFGCADPAFTGGTLQADMEMNCPLSCGVCPPAPAPAPGAATVDTYNGNAACWSGAYTYSRCCNPLDGIGDQSCWFMEIQYDSCNCDPATGNQCFDDPAFTDGAGQPCTVHAGFGCADPAFTGGTLQADMEMNCPLSCGVCPPAPAPAMAPTPAPGNQCSDDPSFVDGAGQPCTSHAGFGCADPAFTGGTLQADMEIGCLLSCGICSGEFRQPTCGWDATYTFAGCCDLSLGPTGDANCWFGSTQFSACCTDLTPAGR